jgi:hypothetical protein
MRRLLQPKQIADSLFDRYVGASWDLGELIAAKDEIISKNLLVTKLSVPSNSK